MIKQNFNRNWFFRDGCRDVFADLLKRDEAGCSITLPHDASIGRPRDAGVINGAANGYYQEGNYTYRKEFVIEEEHKEKNIYFEFEGVYQNAFVYINRSFAGKCPYGYSNFYIDATKYIRFGRRNVIEVQVKNAVPSSRWYTGGGIYRDVNIMIVDRMHFTEKGVRLTTVSLEKDLAVIDVEPEIEYTGTGVRSVVCRCRLYDADGLPAAEAEMPVTVAEHTREGYRFRMYVKNPHTWDADTPYCYRYHAYILEDGRTTDEECGSFGIRMLQLDAVNGLRVNGKTVKLRGGCIHHDNGVIGSAEFSHPEEQRIKTLKKAGYNAVRSAHHPMSRKLLDACDKYGMYVMDEFSDVWTSSKTEFDYAVNITEWWERDVTRMVDKDYNHPCVIMYSVGNEISETGNRMDVQFGKKIVDCIRKLDRSRYITNCINFLHSLASYPDIGLKEFGEEESLAFLTERQDDSAAEVNSFMNNLRDATRELVTSDLVRKVAEEALAQVDIAGYNYAACRYEDDCKRYPDRIIVGSETYPKDLDINWKLVKKLPRVIGDFSWSAWDYLGEAGVGRINYEKAPGRDFYAPYPYRAAYCGDINLTGARRPVSYWRETVWGLRHRPYLAVQPPEYYGAVHYMTNWAMTNAVRSWNWKGYEHRPVVVEVYTDAQEAALYINGRMAGRKEVGQEKECIVRFDTVYEPGQVEVVAYTDGTESGRDVILTAGDNVHIEAAADRACIPADGLDVCFVEIELKDCRGILNPQAEKEVSIAVEGAGMLLGYGSADPDTEECYCDCTARAFEGRLRAVIRGNGAEGEIAVRLSAEGCEEKTIRINAE